MSERLFETALGIGAPWFVAGADFNAQARTLTINVDFAAGTRFAAPGVAGEYPVHDSDTKRYRHLNLPTSTFSSMAMEPMRPPPLRG